MSGDMPLVEGGGPRPPLPLSVVIPARNRLPLLRYLLQSLVRGRAAPSQYEIIVVDDGSTDGTAEWVAAQARSGGVRLVRHASARGRGQSRNAGFRVSAGEIVLFLDADVLAPPGLVLGHLRAHAASPAPCCVTGYPWFWRDIRTWRFPEDGDGPPGPLLDPALVDQWPALERWAGGSLTPAGSRSRLAPTDEAPFLWCVTRALSVRRPLLAALGGFCEGFAGYGLEDWEFGYRLMRAGVRVVSDPAAAVFHQAHPPADRGRADLYRNYHVFLDLHPEAEVGLMPLVPAWAGQEAYARLCAGVARVRESAPALHAALTEAAVAFGRSWARGQGRAPRPAGWVWWAGQWGDDRTRRILDEQVRILGDGRARPAVAAFDRLVGGARA